MQSYEPDACCGKHIAKALRDGVLDAAVSWECPKCGLEWKPRTVTAPLNGASGESITVRHWEPRPVLLIL